MKKLLSLVTLLAAGLQGVVALAQVNVGAGSAVGLQPITLPTFFSLDQIENFSFYSYISFGLSLIFVILGVVWVVIIIRAGVQIMRSNGDAGEIQSGWKKMGNVFWSVSILILFFVIASVVAAFFGLGGFWEWPKRLSICDDGTLYFRTALENPSLSQEQIDANCFGGGGGSSNAACRQKCATLDSEVRKACEAKCAN